MEKVLQAMKDLKKAAGDNWINEMLEYMKDEDKYTHTVIADNIDNFLRALREAVIADKSMEELSHEMDQEVLYGTILPYIKHELQGYYLADAIRTMDCNNIEKAKLIVEEVFKKSILRKKLSFTNEFNEIGFTKKEELANTITVLNSLTNFVVINFLDKESMQQLIHENIRISEELCLHIVKMIEDNYEKIQTKLLLEKLYTEEN